MSSNQATDHLMVDINHLKGTLRLARKGHMTKGTLSYKRTKSSLNSSFTDQNKKTRLSRTGESLDSERTDHNLKVSKRGKDTGGRVFTCRCLLFFHRYLSLFCFLYE